MVNMEVLALKPYRPMEYGEILRKFLENLPGKISDIPLFSFRSYTVCRLNLSLKLSSQQCGRFIF